MIDITAWATWAIKLPSQKQTHAEIIGRCISWRISSMYDLQRYLLLYSSSFDWHIIMLGTNCFWQDSPHMWCMAGRQYRWLLCCNWTLDWGESQQEVDARKWPTGLCPDEHFSQWCLIRSSPLQGLQMPHDHSLGKFNLWMNICEGS